MSSAFTLRGDISTYNNAVQASVRRTLAHAANVTSSAVDLRLSAASVLATADIYLATEAEADAAAQALTTGIMATSSSLELALRAGLEDDLGFEEGGGASLVVSLAVEAITVPPEAEAGMWSTSAAIASTPRSRDAAWGAGVAVGCAVASVALATILLLSRKKRMLLGGGSAHGNDVVGRLDSKCTV